MKKILLMLSIILILSSCNAKTQSSLPALSIIKQTLNTEISKDIIVLSYPDLELDKLTRVTLELPRNKNISLAQSTADSLLSGKGAEGHFVPFNSKAYIIKAEVSRDMINLNIGGDFSELTKKELFCSVISLSNTLCELEDIKYSYKGNNKK